MIDIENTKIVGFEPAIRGMRNPMNSWDKSDSEFDVNCEICDNKFYDCKDCPTKIFSTNHADNVLIGPNDLDLMKRLARAGSVDAKYRRMIVVYVDLTAPLYWWKEFDTYKVGTVANSCSTMHKIHAKEFTLDDFSHEHLDDLRSMICDSHDSPTVFHFSSMDLLKLNISALNYWREQYLRIAFELKACHFNELDKRETLGKLQKQYWWQMIQLLPTTYNQKRTVMLNYEVLANIYPNRRNHKLDEWRELCTWIVSLPYSEIITGVKK